MRPTSWASPTGRRSASIVRADGRGPAGGERFGGPLLDGQVVQAGEVGGVGVAAVEEGVSAALALHGAEAVAGEAERGERRVLDRGDEPRGSLADAADWGAGVGTTRLAGGEGEVVAGDVGVEDVRTDCAAGLAGGDVDVDDFDLVHAQLVALHAVGQRVGGDAGADDHQREGDPGELHAAERAAEEEVVAGADQRDVAEGEQRRRARTSAVCTPTNCWSSALRSWLVRSATRSAGVGAGVGGGAGGGPLEGLAEQARAVDPVGQRRRPRGRRRRT